MTKNCVKARAFVTRLMRNERGSHTTELALAIALFALIAGFGFFTYGDALADFFVALGGKFGTDKIMFPQFGVNPIAPAP